MNQGYTSEEIYEDLLAKASTKQGKKVKGFKPLTLNPYIVGEPTRNKWARLRELVSKKADECDKNDKKVKEIEEQQKLYEKGYKDGVEFCKTIMLEKFALAGYKFDKNK